MSRTYKKEPTVSVKRLTPKSAKKLVKKFKRDQALDFKLSIEEESTN